MLTADELAQYQQDADDEAAQSNADRGKRLRRTAISLLAMAATLTGVATGGDVSEPLAAPTLDWDDQTADTTPDFTVSWDAEVGDIIVLQRSATSGFASYVEAQDTLDTIDQTELDFDFGDGGLAAGTYYFRAFYTRGGEDSEYSSTQTVTIV